MGSEAFLEGWDFSEELAPLSLSQPCLFRLFLGCFFQNHPSACWGDLPLD